MKRSRSFPKNSKEKIFVFEIVKRCEFKYLETPVSGKDEIASSLRFSQ